MPLVSAPSTQQVRMQQACAEGDVVFARGFGLGRLYFGGHVGCDSLHAHMLFFFPREAHPNASENFGRP